MRNGRAVRWMEGLNRIKHYVLSRSIWDYPFMSRMKSVTPSYIWGLLYGPISGELFPVVLNSEKLTDWGLGLSKIMF